jgi:hypothetical protein
MSQLEYFHRVVVTGVDGSGKSATTADAARQLSSAYPDSDIRVADSTGLFFFRGGEVASSRFTSLDRMEPSPKASKLETMVRMGAFTVSRQAIEYFSSFSSHSLVIGVRDPFRVDLATYMPIIAETPPTLTPERRLKLLNKFTKAVHPSLMALLKVDVVDALHNTAVRDFVNQHETPEKITLAAKEYPKVLDAYYTEYDVPYIEVNALKPNSSELLAMAFEEFVPPPKKSS